jgi:hypothetical protein
MNIVRGLTSVGDWGGWGNGAGAYIAGNAQVAQNIQTRLNTFLGECFFATNAGVNWYVYLGYPGQQQAINLGIASVISNTQDVLNIVSVKLNITTSTRIFVITYTVNTIYTTNFFGSAEVNI